MAVSHLLFSCFACASIARRVQITRDEEHAKGNWAHLMALDPMAAFNPSGSLRHSGPRAHLPVHQRNSNPVAQVEGVDGIVQGLTRILTGAGITLEGDAAITGWLASVAALGAAGVAAKTAADKTAIEEAERLRSESAALFLEANDILKSAEEEAESIRKASSSEASALIAVSRKEEDALTAEAARLNADMQRLNAEIQRLKAEMQAAEQAAEEKTQQAEELKAKTEKNAAAVIEEGNVKSAATIKAAEDKAGPILKQAEEKGVSASKLLPTKEEIETSSPTGETSAPTGDSSPRQDFLEFEPYTDRSRMPDNTYKPKSPFEGKVISVERIVGPKATGETCNIVIDHGGAMPYIEGQSYGVIPPGSNPKTGKPNKVRLYSIASSRYGDDMTGKTTTLCVRRATYWCPEMKAEDPAKKGVCSNYLCDASPGDVVKMTGPSGKVMLLPEDKPETDIIMVATGTGIAPYRSFLRRMFIEKTPYAADFKGLAWLFLGVANSDALLYDEDWKAIAKEHPDQFRYDVALSREQTNKDGGKMYIQDRVEEYADEIFDRLDKGAHIYFCGLKGMMPGIQAMLEKVAKSKGLDYEEFIKKLKSNKQWHVEVY